jgi:hypothetical protein
MKGRLYIFLLLLLFPILSRGEVAFDCQQVIYDFLKRYSYDLSKGAADNVSVEQKMKSDRVITLHGSYRLLPKSWEKLDLSVIYYENRGYEAVWKLSGDTLWHIVFPNSYELILGKSRNELETTLKDDIIKTSQEYKYTDDSVSVIPIFDSIFISQNNKRYASKELSTAAYYKLDADGHKVLLRDVNYPKQLAVNLCQYPLFQDIQLSVTQNLYANKTDNYTLPLDKWLSYCQQQESIIYVGIEKEDKDLINVLVICENKPLGYNHMLSALFSVNDGRLVLREPIAVSLTAYIPTYNIIKD